MWQTRRAYQRAGLAICGAILAAMCSSGTRWTPGSGCGSSDWLCGALVRFSLESTGLAATQGIGSEHIGSERVAAELQGPAAVLCVAKLGRVQPWCGLAVVPGLGSQVLGRSG